LTRRSIDVKLLMLHMIVWRSISSVD